ncbi:ribosomal L1 domain-containing protein 1 [Nematolebias whitei]|uniref:ribosomal L1 domain-containing protein 1 n=1 Tax=Nematolebias whitei TaxID=451745 RepID=UPI0018995B3C|nr:ribosomal L1 domain-containing protein 1 [Nematolebias whitei]
MAEKAEVKLDRAQVKKAVQALQAFLKTKATGDKLLLDETQKISLLFTMWKIPKKAQTFRIPLPHGQRSDSEEVCLFTKDEPRMTSEQTQRFYKKLLQVKGVKNMPEIIPYKVLKTEYKPHEAKCRLLGKFNVFLSDDRVRRLLPSHLGKHFYERNKAPLCVNLQSKTLARDIQRLVQGTTLKMNNRGPCCMARVAHSGMTADEVTDNIEAAVQTVADKLQTKRPAIKVIHLKSETSVALPIYTSDLSHLSVPPTTETANEKKVEKNKKKDDKPSEEKIKLKKKKMDEEEEEIPQLVPIETPAKKTKLEKSSKKQTRQKTPKPVVAKSGVKTQKKPAKKTVKMATPGKRKAPKVK